MSDIFTLTARARARERRRAVLVRERSALSADPECAWGIVPLKVVSEEQVQAIAYGPLDQLPTIATRLHPLSRDASDLEGFAADLDGYVADRLEDRALPRIWIPTEADIELLEMIGFRYRTNTEATVSLRRMGHICHVLAAEARRPGQQAVAVARAVLAEHLVTGQSALLDGHLWALMAWIEPEGGDPEELAAERARVPAATQLDEADDLRIERLRHEAKRGSARAEGEIHELLDRAAQTVWDRMVDARRAIWNRGLDAADLDELVARSTERLVGDYGALRGDRSPPNRPKTLGNLLDQEQLLVEIVEKTDLRDFARREAARQTGSLFAAEVIAQRVIDRRTNGFRLTLTTAQPIVRTRRGAWVRLLRGKVGGRVESVAADPAGGYRIELAECTGIRSLDQVAIGSVSDWTDIDATDMTIPRMKARAFMDGRQPALIYAEELPAPLARAVGRRRWDRRIEALRR